MGQCLKQHFSESVLLYDDNPEDPTSAKHWKNSAWSSERTPDFWVI